MVARCPQCGKKLEHFERFCYQCEVDNSKHVDELQKPRKMQPIKGDVKGDIDNVKAITKGLKALIKEKSLKLKKKAKIDVEIQAYCVKCRKKIIIKNPKDYVMKNGFLAAKGKCPKCDTKVFRIIKKIKS